MEKKLTEQKSILQKKINQFTKMSKNTQQNGGDISVINKTTSIFGNNTSVDKYKLIENKKILKKNNSNSKSNKSLKTVKKNKLKIGNSSSNISVNSKRVITSNNYNSNSKNLNIKLNDNDIYGANNGNLINVNINEDNDNNLYNNNNSNNKFNYYYNNDNFYYQHGIKDPETKEELRKNSLLDIFYFYTKQYSFLGQTPTFQEILKSEEHLDLAEFGKFCVEFKILVKPHKIAEIFKKTANNSKELNYALFIKTLQKLSICANDEKKQYLMERIKIYNMKLKEIKEKNKKDGNNENEQNKTKEKEENLSGIKSEGEAEDDEK
jgi:hypothetical protein